jgi:hypothetical protein
MRKEQMRKGKGDMERRNVLEVGCPCEPEHGDCKGDAAEDCEGQTVFGSKFVELSLSGVDLFLLATAVKDDDDAAEHGSENSADQGKLAHARVPAAHLLEDDGVDGEEHVEQGVHDGEVDGNEERDGVEENDPGAGEGDLVDAHKVLVAVLDLSPDILVPRDLGLADALGLVAQDGGRMGLGDGEHEDGGGAAEHEEDVKGPVPVLLELEEAGDDGAERGPDPEHGGEAAHGVCALDGVPQVGQDAGAVAQGRGDKGAREEPADEETAEVGGEGAEEVEGQVGCEGAVEDPSAAVELAQGREDERAGAVSEQEDGDGETGSLHGYVEGLGDGLEAAAGGAGRKGGVHDEEDGRDGDEEAAGHGPVSGVLDVTGSEVDVAMFVEVGGLIVLKVLCAVRLVDRPREDAGEGTHGE